MVCNANEVNFGNIRRLDKRSFFIGMTLRVVGFQMGVLSSPNIDVPVMTDLSEALDEREFNSLTDDENATQKLTKIMNGHPTNLRESENLTDVLTENVNDAWSATDECAEKLTEFGNEMHNATSLANGRMDG
jgi:hypothetical protein